MFYSCDEHIDIALEEAIDEREMPPEIVKVSEEEKLSTTCFMCEKTAGYKVSG
ncbi:CxxH/CxxC protein [Evansella halocellulosilytica]|uniref:CxxH/CxxC protein n=1 Tax=Evansella halocellulosilytica TaxID=2011013 RepID=UPI000BB7FE95|nr:CxxH/CxxC protein [Evansella halocellulosilytica]